MFTVDVKQQQHNNNNNCGTKRLTVAALVVIRVETSLVSLLGYCFPTYSRVEMYITFIMGWPEMQMRVKTSLVSLLGYCFPACSRAEIYIALLWAGLRCKCS